MPTQTKNEKRVKLSLKQTYAFDTLDRDDVDEVLYGGAKGGGKSFLGCAWCYSRAINIIKQAGGISIIAHPITLNFKTFDNFEKQVQQLAVLGLDGIEVFSSMHTHEEIDEFERIAHKYNLIISGGSDFHGDKGKELGIYIDGEPIPPDILKSIEKYRLLYCSM